MKVTLIVCDRCGREMPEDEVGDRTLELKLRYEDPRSGWRPLRERASLELCPQCREAFADWLGDRAEEIDGLGLEDVVATEDVAYVLQRAMSVPAER